MSSFPTTLSDLAAAIRRLRQPTGMSQERFAFAIKLHRTKIGSLERGKGNPTLKTLCSVADGLGISVAELFAVAAGRGKLLPAEPAGPLSGGRSVRRKSTKPARQAKRGAKRPRRGR
jgi:transcriptional regulator with XRE-family HTH domain